MKGFAEFGIQLKAGASGEVKTTCPQCSHTRRKRNYPCLNVNVDKGAWHCWHCGWAGGLKQGEIEAPRINKAYRKPEYVAKAPADEAGKVNLPAKVREFFAERAITDAVLIRNRIGVSRQWFPQIEDEKGCIAFPYLRGEEVVNVKYRTLDKLFRMEAGAERVLYGINDIASTTIWVEGEIDKLSLEVAGFANCVSVPDGAPSPGTKNYSSKFDWINDPALEQVKFHVIAVDEDAPGAALRDELVRRLGREHCLVVRWPDGCKDANDVLVRLGADELASCVEAAEPLPIEGVQDAEEFREVFMQRYQYGAPKGVSTGWADVDPYYTVLSGEWTLVTGIPGHGKSEWLDGLMVNLSREFGWKHAVFSPENHPIDYHMQKLSEKYWGKPFEDGPTQRMSIVEADEAVAWIGQHFKFLAPEDPSLDVILEQARQLVRRFGIRGLVIDPWNEVDHTRADGSTETEYISRALSKVRAFARNNDVHVWIVAHPTKMQKQVDGTYGVPTPYDVSGSAHWRNKADNSITVYNEFIDGKHNTETQIHVQKIRKKQVGRVGQTALRYDRVTGVYSDFQRDGSGHSFYYSGER